MVQVAVSEGGTVLAVTDDPGSSLPTPGHPDGTVTTWYLWDRTGALARSGSADMTGCGSRIGDLCQSPATAGAMSPDGTRFAVASAIAQSPLDGTRGLLQVGSVSSGATVNHFFTNPIAAVALDRNGATVAVLERVPPAPGASGDKAQVNLFTFDGTTLTAVFTPYAIAAPAAGMALSRDGLRLAIAADHLYLFSKTPLAPSVDSGMVGAVTSVAVAPAAPHGVLAGYASGMVASFDDSSPLARASLSMGSAAVTAVATDGKSGFAGDATGHLARFAITPLTPFLASLSTQTAAPDSVKGLVRSADSQQLLVASATELHYLLLWSGNMTEAWMQKPASAPVGGGADAAGDLAAVGVGAGVILYDSSHGITADAPAKASVPPHVARDLDVTYRNTGNRNEHVEAGAWFPANWFMTVTPTSFEVPVNGEATVAVHYVVGVAEPPGLTNLRVDYTLDSGTTGSTLIPVEVVAKDAVALDPDGPASVALQRGQTVHFTVRVTNHGNADAHIDVQSSLQGVGWASSLSIRHFDLKPGGGDHLDASLTAPSDAADGAEGRLRLTMAGRPGAELDLVGVVGARFEPKIIVPGVANAGPGQTLEVKVTLQNAGNVADAFDLDVSGILPDGWSMQFPEGGHYRTALLEPATLEVATLVVHVPDDASGQRVQLHLLAKSAGDGGKTDDHGVLVIVAGVAPGGGQGSPFPGVAWIMVAFALALLGRTTVGRRRGR